MTSLSLLVPDVPGSGCILTLKNVLREILHVSPRSCTNLHENTLQAQAVVPSATYGKILLRYLSAYK